jgi:regulator of protease activity HflC (stomatin/prohibitin superfamily)
MGKLIVAVVLFAALFILGKVLKSLGKTNESKRAGSDGTFAFGGNACFVLAFVALFGMLAYSTIRIVDPGQVGVVVEFGKVQERPLNSGVSFVKPWADIESMDRQINKHTATYGSATADQQTIEVDMTLNFKMLADSAPKIFDTIGIEYADRIIIPAAQEVLKAETALYKASEILVKRPQMKSKVQDNLAKWLVKYGVQLTEISIADVRFDDEYEAAIKKKQVQEQQALEKVYQLQSAEKQAEIAAATAKGQADAAREAAKGEADALKIKGEAQAEYNERVAASLTPALIQRQWLEKWSGDLPRYMMGGDGNVMPLIQIPEDKK